MPKLLSDVRARIFFLCLLLAGTHTHIHTHHHHPLLTTSVTQSLSAVRGGDQNTDFRAAEQCGACTRGGG